MSYPAGWLGWANTRPPVALLTLAFECYEERLNADPSVAEQIEELLERGVEDPDPDRRRIINLRQLSAIGSTMVGIALGQGKWGFCSSKSGHKKTARYGRLLGMGR